MISQRLRRWLSDERIAHSGSMLTSGVVGAVIAFASNLILVRFIAPEQFGEFALGLATVGIFLAVMSLRTGVQVLRLRDEEMEDGAAELYWNVLFHETVLAGALAGASLAWLGQLSPLTTVLLLGVLVQHFVNNSIAFYERGRPYHRLAALEAGSQLVSHLLAVCMVLLGAGAAALYVRELAIGLILGGGLAAAGGLTLMRPRILAVSDWRRVLDDVKGIWLEGALEGAFQRATVLVAGAVASAGAVGFLYQARRLAVVPQQLLSPVTSRVLLNWLRESDAPRAILVKVLALFVAPLAAVALACVVFADPVVPWLFGEAWAPVARLLVLMVGVVVFYSLFAVTKTYLIATRHTRYLLIARVFQWVGLALPLGLAARSGAIGVENVAEGLSLSYAFAFSVSLYFSLRQR